MKRIGLSLIERFPLGFLVRRRTETGRIDRPAAANRSFFRPVHPAIFGYSI